MTIRHGSDATIGLRVASPGRVLDAAGARLHRPGIRRDVADAILAPYGLRATKRVRNLPAGRRNRSVAVPTPAGLKVLKRYRDQWAASTIVHEHSILRHLASRGFPAVRVESTLSGDTFVEREDGRFALFAFEDGVNLAGFLLPLERRVRLWRLAGRLLARFHRAMEGFAPEGRHHLGYREPFGERSRDLAWHLGALEDLARRPGPAVGAGSEADVRWLCGNAARIGERILVLHEALVDVPLARSVIHGDYGLHNILFGREGTPTLLDFELARSDWRLIDIVTVLSRVEARRLARSFLDGYEAVAGPPGDEWRFLPDVWQFYRLSGAVQSWFTYARLGDARRLATARERVEEADRISEDATAAWGAAR
jgi:Ser/Thr protein kinase RdoA (MazF antagonist)